MKRRDDQVRFEVEAFVFQKQKLLICPPSRDARVEYLVVVSVPAVEKRLQHVRVILAVGHAVAPRIRATQNENPLAASGLLAFVLAIAHPQRIDRQLVAVGRRRPVRDVSPAESLIVKVPMAGDFVAGFLDVNRSWRKSVAKPRSRHDEQYDGNKANDDRATTRLFRRRIGTVDSVRSTGGGPELSLPSLEALDRINVVSLVVGFPLLSLGVVTGIVWVQTAKGVLWTASTHETWTIVAWAIYAGLVAARFFGRQGSRQAAASAVAGFAFLAFAVLGVGLVQ